MANLPKPVDISSAEEVGRRLALIRQWRGINQTLMARLCEMSVQAWNNNECGRDRISIDPALRLCRLTGVSLDYIYWGSTSLLPASLLEVIHRRQRPAPSPRHHAGARG